MQKISPTFDEGTRARKNNPFFEHLPTNCKAERRDDVGDGHQQFLHLLARQAVQRTKRFVHQQDVGLGRQRPGNSDALAHAAGNRTTLLKVIAIKDDLQAYDLA